MIVVHVLVLGMFTLMIILEGSLTGKVNMLGPLGYNIYIAHRKAISLPHLNIHTASAID